MELTGLAAAISCLAFKTRTPASFILPISVALNKFVTLEFPTRIYLFCLIKAASGSENHFVLLEFVSEIIVTSFVTLFDEFGTVLNDLLVDTGILVWLYLGW